MRISFYMLTALLCTSLHLGAQSFSYETVKLQYRLPAMHPFKTPFSTVTVRFHGEEYLKLYGMLPSELLAGDFKFLRYENVSEHGDLHFDVMVGKPEFLGVEQEKQQKTVDEKVVTSYYYRGSVITPISYTLRDGARNVIEEKIMFSAADHMYFTTEQFGTSSALIQYWKESKNVVASKMIAGILANNLNKTAMAVRERFDDLVITDDVLLFDLKKAEKVNAQFMNTAFAEITKGLSENPIVSDWDDARKTRITELLTKGTSFDPDNKDEQEVFAIAHYNLAALNMFWHNPGLAKNHLQKGLRADKKKWEFGQLEKRLATFDGRGIADALSGGSYVAQYQDGADEKIPQIKTGTSSGSALEDMSGKKSRTIDTVYVNNGDTIIGYVNAVHDMHRVGTDHIHDLKYLQIEPINMPQKEVKVMQEDVLFMHHKGIYMKPLETRIVGVLNPPIHLYEPLKVSEDETLGLMRTAYHESMPYTLNRLEDRVYLYALKRNDSTEYEILPLSGGARYALNLNGALAKDFESCSKITSKANQKYYSMEEEKLKELVDDYEGCRKK